MAVQPSEFIDSYLFWYGIYEDNTARYFYNTLQPHEIVLDIGANMGYYSTIAAGMPHQATVYAFEPNTALINQFKKTIQKNNFNTIHIIPNGVGNQHLENKTLYLNEDGNIGMSSLRQPEGYRNTALTIQMVTIDEWIKNRSIPQLHWIKIDIEGAEIQALQGMRNTLIQYTPKVIIEIASETLSRFGHTKHDILDYFKTLNYIPYAISAQSKLIAINDFAEIDNENVVFIAAKDKQ